jgi:Putative HNHc nuclease
MKPVRDPAHLAFIRSLPCAVCRRERTIEAAHVGRRGLSQKSSDRETLPLCNLHHREQHRVGLKQFARDYNLDIPAMLEALNEKPRIRCGPFCPTWIGHHLTDMHSVGPVVKHYWAEYRDQMFKLFPVSQGLTDSIELAKMLCREYLIESVFKSRVFR